MFTQPMTTSIVSTGSESVTFTPPRTSEMSADLNHVVASNFGVSSGDFTKSNSPVLNPFANNRSEQINKPFDPNNYFEQREKELNHREAYLILRENALTKGPLAAGERSPEGGTDYPSENVWPSVEPNPFKKYVANVVGYQHHTSHVNRRSYEHGPSSFANKAPRTEVPPPPGFQTFGGSRGFELHRENYTPVGYDLPPPGFGDLGQEYLSLPTGPCGIFDRHDARLRPLPFEGRNMYDGLRYSGEAGDTGLRGHSGSVNEVQGLIDAMRTMTTHINRSHVAPLPKEERFSGDPLTYRRFVKHFDSYLTKGVVDMAEKLDLLISSCAGEARANIADCIMARTPDLGYFEARRILERLYGQDHTIVSAYINKILNGPPIKANDRQALAALGRDMRNCLMACGNLNSAGLDTQQTVSSVFTRLPRHLQDKFVASVTMLLETGRPVTFAMLADFVERRSLVEASFLGQVVEQRGDRGRDKGAKFNQPFRKASINTVQGEASRPFRSNGAGNTQCEFCSLSHALWKCQEFGKESVEKRWSFAKDKHLCFNCLGHHFSKSCKSKVRCSNCKASHHTLLHRAPGETVSPPDGASKEVGNGAGEVRQVMSVSMKQVKPSGESHGLEEEARAARENSTTQTRTCQVRLRVVPVRVWGDGKRLVDTYAFLDEGSDTTLCTDGLIDKLKVRGESVRISLATVNGTETQVARRVSLSAQGFDEVAIIHLPNVISVPSLPGLRSSIPTGRDLDLYPEMLKGVTFPDLECGVELLIGADVPGAHRSLEYRMNHSGGPNAVRCALGWGLVGPTALPREFVANEVGHVNFVQSERVVLNDLMKRMYETDFLSKGKDIDLGASVEDKRALRAMEESVTKVSGHYQISLPWRSARAKLPNNKMVAENRLEYLGKRLEKDPEMHQKYRDKMKEYLENGHARKVPKDSLAPSLKTWYVPHHATRGKFRIVFDCAAKFRGTSLNDHLLQGPDHTSSLVGVLLRFRSRPIAVMADIKGMFHQVRVGPADCDSLRFLWWPDGNLEAKPEEYQMLVHLFGATSSPSVCGYALLRVATDNETLASKKVIQALRRNFYVDDLLISFDSENEAAEVVKELKDLLEGSGFHLTKFLSNSLGSLSSVSKEDCRISQGEVDINSPRTEKALGVTWDPGLDEFRFQIRPTEKAVTRRGILSTISQCYDPLGMIQPALLPAKKLLQELCSSGLGWDDPIKAEDKSFWKQYVNLLGALGRTRVPRCYRPCQFEPVEVQLHCFCDASQKGYGTVLYLRFVGPLGQVHCSFVMGRSRVAPIKPMTIPRLELVAAVVGAELTEFVQNELDFDPDEVVYWTDSTSVLGYIRSTARRYRTFVANRIAVIQSLSSPEQWRHVSTDQNPADVASRGQMPDQLPQSDIWFNGPAFLWLEQDKWPIASENSNSDSTISDAELLKCHQVLHAVCKTTSAETDPLGPLLTYFSTFTKLKRAVAWFVRLTKIIRAKSSKALGNLMLGPVLFASELASAELDIVKHVQLCSFPEELASLKNENISANNDKSLTGRNLKTSRLRKLSPVLVNGVLCVGGRLQRSSLPVASKHPIVLPSAHHVTSLIVLHAHAAEGHSGPLHTLAKIREKYWVVRGHATVRKVLNTCTICRVRRASPGQQFMAPLPTPRVTPGRAPFASCGVDYAGPLLTRVGRSNTKRYICLFTCLATRAVHLEMACALDIDSFLEAFTRFSNRRGTPEELWSDNATNFVGANKELRDSIRDWNQTNIQSSLARRGVTWKFNPPAASHQGGVWERMVRSVKRVLNVIAGGLVMTDESLSTLLTEVERIVNSRPITAVSSDPRDLEALTPHHLLTGRTDATLPLGKFIHADGYRKSWRLVGLKADQFWSRWVKEYLPLLQHREKWLVPKRNLRVGDLVLIAGESMTRGQWPKGLIEETFAGKDGLVRSARVRTATSPALIRDVRKLHLLEASH